MSLEGGGGCVAPQSQTFSLYYICKQLEWQLAIDVLVVLSCGVEGSVGTGIDWVGTPESVSPTQVLRSYISSRSAVTLRNLHSLPLHAHPHSSGPSLWRSQRSISFTASGSYG